MSSSTKTLLLLAASCAVLLGLSSAKVYERCELAKELQNKWGFPANQVATWVCIAHRESNYDMSAIGRLNTDGSADHGIFQINDRYWCDRGAAGCGVSCADVRSSMDVSVKCVRTVYDETKRLRGNGFEAWTTYKYCLSPASYLDGCGI